MPSAFCNKGQHWACAGWLGRRGPDKAPCPCYCHRPEVRVPRLPMDKLRQQRKEIA